MSLESPVYVKNRNEIQCSSYRSSHHGAKMSHLMLFVMFFMALDYKKEHRKPCDHQTPKIILYRSAISQFPSLITTKINGRTKRWNNNSIKTSSICLM